MKLTCGWRESSLELKGQKGALKGRHQAQFARDLSYEAVFIIWLRHPLRSLPASAHLAQDGFLAKRERVFGTEYIGNGDVTVQSSITMSLNLRAYLCTLNSRCLYLSK